MRQGKAGASSSVEIGVKDRRRFPASLRAPTTTPSTFMISLFNNFAHPVRTYMPILSVD
jgi:hypothetical protein